MSERETVTDLAAAPPEPPEPPRRRLRVRHYAAMVAILAIVGVAAWLIVARFQRGYQYRAEVKAVLTPLASGDPAAVEALYREASPRFQRILINDKFLDLADRIHQTLGGFQRIVDVVEVERTSTIAGRATRVVVVLDFARGRTRGEVSFLLDEKADQERLLGVSIDIPEHLVAHSRELEFAARLAAPPEVLEAVERIARLLEEGKVREIHGAASEAFKRTVSEVALAELTERYEDELGDFVKLVSIVTSAQSGNRDRARVQALLEYQKRRTTATFEFQQVDDTWQLLAFQVVVPEPLSPRSGPPPEPDERPSDEPEDDEP